MSAMGNTTVANTSLDRRALGNAAFWSASLDPSAVVNTAPGSASLDRSAVGHTTVPNMFLGMSVLRNIAPRSASSDTSALGNTALGSADRRAMGNSTVPNMSLDPSALRNIAPGSASFDRSALVNTNNDAGWSPLLTNFENPISRPTELGANMNIPKQSTGSSAPLQSWNGQYGDLQTPPVPASPLGPSHLSLSSTDQVSPVSQFGLFGSSDRANVMQPAQIHEYLPPFTDQNVALPNQQFQIEQALTSSACNPPLPYTPCQSVADGSLATSAVRTQVDNVPRNAALQRQHAEAPRPSFAQLMARLPSRIAALDMSAMGNTTVANTSLDRRALGNTASWSASLDPSALVNTASGSASLDMSAVRNTTVPDMSLDMSELRNIAPGSASLDTSAPGSAFLDRSALGNSDNDAGWSPQLKNRENPISRPAELDVNMNVVNQSTGSSAPLQSCYGQYGDLQTPPVPASSLGSSHLSLSSTDQVSPVSQFGLFGSAYWANVMQETALSQNKQKVKNQERIERRRNRNRVAAARCKEKAKMKAAEDSQKIQEQAETIEKLRKIVASQKIIIDHYPTCAACGNIPS
ncbi:uncharacterized protein LOC135811578 isoform X2 [Sycon ciliatum]|uniref:uncharacterized protein LOC135811578 isoform X2 n=1 Tax=Sycon ciliatum TaxID=27933 RepID=UPI0031F6C999